MELYDSKRKVVLVRGDANKFYEQAIFILRAGAAEGQIDFVKEAERIINASASRGADARCAPLRQPNPPSPEERTHVKRARGRKRSIDGALNFAIFIIGTAIVALLIMNLM